MNFKAVFYEFDIPIKVLENTCWNRSWFSVTLPEEVALHSKIYTPWLEKPLMKIYKSGILDKLVPGKAVYVATGLDDHSVFRRFGVYMTYDNRLEVREGDASTFAYELESNLVYLHRANQTRQNSIFRYSKSAPHITLYDSGITANPNRLFRYNMITGEVEFGEIDANLRDEVKKRYVNIINKIIANETTLNVMLVLNEDGTTELFTL